MGCGWVKVSDFEEKNGWWGRGDFGPCVWAVWCLGREGKRAGPSQVLESFGLHVYLPITGTTQPTNGDLATLTWRRERDHMVERAVRGLGKKPVRLQKWSKSGEIVHAGQ